MRTPLAEGNLMGFLGKAIICVFTFFGENK